MRAWMKETSTFRRTILVGILLNFIVLVYYLVGGTIETTSSYEINIVLAGTFIILIGLVLSQRLIKKLELWKPIILIILMTPITYLSGNNPLVVFVGDNIMKIMFFLLPNTSFWSIFPFFLVILIFSCPIAIFWFRFVKKSDLWKEYLVATIVLTIPVGMLVISNAFLLLLPAFIAVISLVLPEGASTISASGNIIPGPVGSMIFFFLPFIVVSWALKKKKMSIPMILIISFIVASIIYHGAINTGLINYNLPH